MVLILRNCQIIRLCIWESCVPKVSVIFGSIIESTLPDLQNTHPKLCFHVLLLSSVIKHGLKISHGWFLISIASFINFVQGFCWQLDYTWGYLWPGFEGVPLVQPQRLVSLCCSSQRWCNPRPPIFGASELSIHVGKRSRFVVFWLPRTTSKRCLPTNMEGQEG